MERNIIAVFSINSKGGVPKDALKYFYKCLNKIIFKPLSFTSFENNHHGNRNYYNNKLLIKCDNNVDKSKMKSINFNIKGITYSFYYTIKNNTYDNSFNRKKAGTNIVVYDKIVDDLVKYHQIYLIAHYNKINLNLINKYPEKLIMEIYDLSKSIIVFIYYFNTISYNKMKKFIEDNLYNVSTKVYSYNDRFIIMNRRKLLFLINERIINLRNFSIYKAMYVNSNLMKKKKD